MILNKIKIFISTTDVPFYNLALEEWALKNADTSQFDYLILYVNKPSVVVGRNQNLFEEVDLTYCRKQGIEVARRISGGGTVFHDEGNLNWAFITAFDTKKVNAYEWAAKWLIDLLKTYGLDAYLTARNAIEVDGLKLSGQAQFTNRKNILSHGTLLVSSDLDYMQPAIEISNAEKIHSKASKSVRSTTVNLSTLLREQISVQDVMDRWQGIANYENADFEIDGVDEQKFRSDSWLFGRSPKFTVQHVIDATVLVLQIEKGIVTMVKNEKGHLVQDSPFLNQTYEKLMQHFNS